MTQDLSLELKLDIVARQLKAAIKKLDAMEKAEKRDHDMYDCFRNVRKANAKRNKVTYCEVY